MLCLVSRRRLQRYTKAHTYSGWMCSPKAEGQFFALRIDASIPHCKDTARNGRFQRTSVCFLSVSLATFFHDKDTAKKMQNQRTIVRFLFVFANHTNMSQVHYPDSFVQNPLQRYGGKKSALSHNYSQVHTTVQKCLQLLSSVIKCPKLYILLQRYGKRKRHFQFIAVYAYFCRLLQFNSSFQPLQQRHSLKKRMPLIGNICIKAIAWLKAHCNRNLIHVLLLSCRLYLYSA